MELDLEKSRLHKTTVVIFVVAPFIAVLFAIWYVWQRLVTWNDIALMFGMYFFTVLGITVGFHRMLTHRSFETGPVMKFILLALGSMAVQGGAIEWAATHIKHHAETDTDDDPHSPLAGFFHAHIGWMINGKYIDLQKYGKWMWKDPVIVMINRTFPLWVLLTFLIPFAIGGWSGLLWGGLVRLFLSQHATWSVNSICHTFGRRMFDSEDLSRNNWLVGMLAFGEGWHNNHHAFPRSAFHGMRWWQFDLSSYIIMGLEKVGLIWNVHRIPQERQEERLVRRDNEATAPINVTSTLSNE